MPLVLYFRRNPGWTLALVLFMAWVVRDSGASTEGFSRVGAQGWGPRHTHTLKGPRVSVFESDSWKHSLVDGSLKPIAQLPIPRSYGFSKRTNLLQGAHFTPLAYLEQIAALQNTYCHQRDILMYYGGIRRRPNPEGLNFNGWSGTDLRKLRALQCRPFIGLETFDRTAVRALLWRLKEAGYGPLDRIYVRIGSEPAYSGYERTPEAYRRSFARTALYINAMNRRLHLNVHTIFAGANHADFTRFSPPEYLFDALGYDLYITPENKDAVLKQLRALIRRYPYKPLVLPEFGIATTGPANRIFEPPSGWATPEWATSALADVLMELGKHPAGVEEITVFSVNVSGRLSDRRWSWAWTPAMYDMLKEWEAAPRKWRKDGFHRYDPQSYPVGRDILFINRPDLRIVYRKLNRFEAPGIPLFLEIRLFLKEGVWKRQTRTLYFRDNETRTY